MSTNSCCCVVSLLALPRTKMTAILKKVIQVILVLPDHNAVHVQKDECSITWSN